MVTFSRHAVIRMAERRISEKSVLACLDGGRSVHERGPVWIYVDEKLRVVFDVESKTVITMFQRKAPRGRAPESVRRSCPSKRPRNFYGKVAKPLFKSRPLEDRL